MKIKKLLLLLILTPIVLVSSLELYYLYKVNDIDPTKSLSGIAYKQETHDLFWVSLKGNDEVSLKESDKIILEPYSATALFYNFLKLSVLDHSKTSFNRNIRLPSLVARNQLILDESKEHKKDWHLRNTSLSIWVSKNYSAKEAINYLLDSMYFGYNIFGLNSASKFYFNKNVNDLELSEEISLISLLKAPAMYSPCNIQRHRERAKVIAENLVKNWPVKYLNFEYKVPDFSFKSNICKKHLTSPST